MRFCIDETYRRRDIQRQFNLTKGIVPVGIVKAVHDITDRVRDVAESSPTHETRRDYSKDDLARVVKELASEMRAAAKHLEFEKAALLRDEMVDLKRLMLSQEAAERGTPVKSSQ